MKPAPVQPSASAAPVAPGRPRSLPQPYDFRRPNKVTRDHVRSLQLVHETFARQFSTVLSTTVRSVSQVQLAAIEQLTHDEFIRRTPNPTYLATVSLEPLSGAGLFHLPLDIVMSIVDRLLGGTGSGTWPKRALTEIESNLISTMMERLLAELGSAFASVTPLQPLLVSQESNPAFAQIAAPSDMVVVAVYDIRMGAETGQAMFCMPFPSLQPVLETLARSAAFAGRITSDPVAVRAALGGRLDEASVAVGVRFGSVTLTSTEIVGLRPGDVLSLQHPTTVPLTVTVDDVPCFTAVPGRKGKRLACRIVDVAPDAHPSPAPPRSRT